MNTSRQSTLFIQRLVSLLRHWISLIILTILLLTACGTPATEPETIVATATDDRIVSDDTPVSELKIIIAIGDSMVSGGRVLKYEGHESTITGGWVIRLQTRLDEDYPGEYQTQNLGIEQVSILGVRSQLPMVIDQNPSIILIQANGDKFNKSTSDDTFKTVLESFQLGMSETIEQILQESPETSIYLVGYPGGIIEYLKLDFPNAVYFEQEVLDDRFRQFNMAMETLAEEYEINFIDILSSWPEDEEERWALFADGMHSDDAGYDLMINIIYDAISDSLESD